jgi:Ran GTPase-activating protein (RanGAP) involved in mRNA processing and transport
VTGSRFFIIKKIDLSSNNIMGEDGARIIANSTSFPNLESLDLRINKLGSQGFKILVQATNYPNLLYLKIDNNKLEDSGAQQLG